MTKREIPIWNFISFDETWLNCDVSRLHELAPAWFNRKQELQEYSEAYKNFVEQLKRRHAIETGVIEHLYEISTGLTETLVEKGIHDMLITHEDQLNGVSKEQLLDHLRDHMNAIDYVFDFIKSNRELTKSYIKELHAIVTQHQQLTEAKDQFGNKIKIPLLKGEFKKNKNNPSRNADDIQIEYLYCPPEHVESEIENLLTLYVELETKAVHPVIIAAWFHHSFSIIHPFQDGNGRMCRLLSSLILIKNGFFPFTIVRIDKFDYINALSSADEKNYQPLVSVFVSRQCALIEEVLEISPETSDSVDVVADILAKRISERDENKKSARILRIHKTRSEIFSITNNYLSQQADKLRQKLPASVHIINNFCTFEDDTRNYYYTFQIGEYASKHAYYFNRNKPRGWIKLSVEIEKERFIQLFVTLHHFGYADDTMAIGGFISYNKEIADNEEIPNAIQPFVPLDQKPLKLSLDLNSGNLNPKNITSYINELIVTFLSILSTEI
jgi:Fic family protein